MNRIAERAGSLGLFVTANALAAAKIDPDLAPRDPRLTDPCAGQCCAPRRYSVALTPVHRRNARLNALRSE